MKDGLYFVGKDVPKESGGKARLRSEERRVGKECC